jgi:hypothetical protein
MPDDPNPNNENKPKSWKESLGELASNEKIAKFESVADLAKAFLNAPSAPAVPENVDGYKLPEGVKIKGLRSMALGQKLTQGQLEGVLKFNSQATKAALEKIKSEREAATATLKKDWGEKYDEKVGYIDKALKHFDKDGELTEYLTRTGAKSDPRVMKFMSSLGALLKEDGFIKGDDNVDPKKGKSAAARMFPNHPQK